MKSAQLTLVFANILAVLLVCHGKTFYESLEVKQAASPEIIKQQYRKLAKLYHPDKSSDPKANEKFIEISTAYETLGDPLKRKEYDLTLREPTYSSPRYSRPDNKFPNKFQNRRTANTFVYETRNVNGRSYTYYYSFGEHRQSFQFSQYQHPANLGSQLVKLFWLSPLPLIILIICLYCFVSCCCHSAPRQNSESDSNEEPMIKPDNQLQESATKSIRQRKIISIVPCNKYTKRLCEVVKGKYKADPIYFCVSEIVDSSDFWGSETNIHCIAVSRNGSRWTTYKSPSDNNLGDGRFDDWIVSILNGEVKWNNASDNPVPIKMNNH